MISTDIEKSVVEENERNTKPDVFSPLDPAALKRLNRKIDLHLIPPIFCLYLLAFLDRTNIGNARIQGLEAGLNMHGQDYNIALFVFFIPYILFEVPSNIIIKKVAPSTWLAFIMVLWGIATVGQGLVRNFGGLVAMRFLIGVFEAGFFPGCVYLISMYYQRYELQWRLGFFFSASILAGAFGGLLAYAIGNMDRVGGYEGWRWIFIIEGLATAIAGLVSKIWIVDWPETAKFLTDEERSMLILKLSQDTGAARMDRLDKRAARRAFGDWKIWAGTLMYIGIVTGVYSTSFFIPTILKQMGYTAAISQIRSIPIYIVSTVCSLMVAIAADKLRHRFGFIILGVVIASIGYIILLNQIHTDIGVRYMACFFIGVGGYIALPTSIVWLANQMSGHYKRSVAAAVQVGVGNIGGIIASNIFITSEAPAYPTGFGVALAGMLFGGAMAVVLFFGLKAENKKRDRGGRDYRLEKPTAELENMGDDHPTFRFTF